MLASSKKKKRTSCSELSECLQTMSTHRHTHVLCVFFLMQHILGTPVTQHLCHKRRLSLLKPSSPCDRQILHADEQVFIKTALSSE